VRLKLSKQTARTAAELFHDNAVYCDAAELGLNEVGRCRG